MPAVSKYSPQLADEICERLANGETLTSVCNKAVNPAMPTPCAVYKWVASNKDFAARFELARKMGCEVVLDKALDIAHAPLKSDDLAVKPADLVAQRRMQIDTHFKFIANINPTKYGDRAVDESKTQPITVNVNTHAGTASVANADKPTE